MTTLSATAECKSAHQPIAPAWHTALAVAIMISLAAGGAWMQHRAGAQTSLTTTHPNAVPLYLSLLLMEWGLFAFVAKGIRRRGLTVGQLIGGRWDRPRQMLGDLGAGFVLWGAWKLIDWSWTALSGPQHAASVDTLLPIGLIESTLWVAVSISAGICEELTFRGYFQRQFAWMAHSRWLAVCLQALLFGVSHGYQGVDACARIALFGLLFGLIAIWRRNLRAGMVAHAWTDIAAGLFGL
jgi:membrane protease YdiL (CAAX protease family)